MQKIHQKKSDLHLYYLPPVKQDSTFNWITVLCEELEKRKNIKINLLNDTWISIPPWKIWSNFFKSKVVKKNGKVFFYELLPFRRFLLITKSNFFLNFCMLKVKRIFFKKISNTVLISAVFNRVTTLAANSLNPSLILTDACDYLDINQFNYSRQLSSATLTNSLPLYNYHKKIGRTYLISAGYYKKNDIFLLNKNFKYRSKTVVFIGTLDRATDFYLIEFSMKELKNFQFRFYFFSRLKGYEKHINAEDIKKNKHANDLWKKIQKMSNYWGKVVVNQSELSKISIEGSVGIIPYNQNNSFNKFRHPIKFYNYKALGLPIVSVVLESISLYSSERCKFTNDYRKFTSYISSLSLISITKKQKDEDLLLAHKHTVEKKCDDVVAIVNKELLFLNQ